MDNSVLKNGTLCKNWIYENKFISNLWWNKDWFCSKICQKYCHIIITNEDEMVLFEVFLLSGQAQ